MAEEKNACEYELVVPVTMHFTAEEFSILGSLAGMKNMNRIQYLNALLGETDLAENMVGALLKQLEANWRARQAGQN